MSLEILRKIFFLLCFDVFCFTSSTGLQILVCLLFTQFLTGFQSNVLLCFQTPTVVQRKTNSQSSHPLSMSDVNECVFV